jgi:hypothetical protein
MHAPIFDCPSQSRQLHFRYAYGWWRPYEYQANWLFKSASYYPHVTPPAGEGEPRAPQFKHIWKPDQTFLLADTHADPTNVLSQGNPVIFWPADDWTLFFGPHSHRYTMMMSDGHVDTANSNTWSNKHRAVHDVHIWLKDRPYGRVGYPW